MHALLAGLWLGTLGVLVIADLSTVLRDADRALRGPIAADMVNGFSPLALICGPLLALTGVITALLHLKPLSSLWITPYSYALLTKLCLVAVVFGLGAGTGGGSGPGWAAKKPPASSVARRRWSWSRRPSFWSSPRSW